MSRRSRYSRILSKIGYLADHKGIINRYLRERGAWDQHLHYCRDYIIKMVKEHNPESVTILGSGWLLDVPLEELSDLTGKINLVDIVHPTQIKHKIKSFRNVFLIEMDLTGGLVVNIWHSLRKGITSINDIEIPAFNADFDPGLVISVNLLTQLDSLPVDYLSKHTDLDEDQLRMFRGIIQQKHIEYLESCPSILITDYIEYIYNHGKISETNDLLFTELPVTDKRVEWEWEFDNTGSYYTGKKVVFKVTGLDLS